MKRKSLFPPPEKADAQGCLGWTDFLNPAMLEDAYSHGIFPWPYEEESVLWFSPPSRTVLDFSNLHIPGRLKRYLKHHPFRFGIDERFEEVLEACSHVPRKGQNGTWITQKLKNAYLEFHDLGFVHSYEAYDGDGKLAGGTYGVSLGKFHCGESMFHYKSEASKFALLSAIATLKNCGLESLDTQVTTPLIARLGAHEIPREAFLKRLEKEIGKPLSTKFLRAHIKTAEDLFAC